MFPEAPAISPRDARRRRVLACQTTATSDLVVKPLWSSDEPRPEWPTRDHRGRLLESQQVGPSIRRFRVELDDRSEYLEGQHAILDVAGVRRCYSMATLSGDFVVEFIAKHYPNGEGSAQLFGLSPGDEFEVELPYGEMWVGDADRPIAMIAGGTGIAPILAMLRKRVVARDIRSIDVFYGAGRQSELVCWEEVDALVKDLPDGRLSCAVVEPATGWTGTVGFVTDALASCRERIARSDVYVAGPPPMVDAVLGQLRDWSVGADRIHYDRFG